jgi:hypothetical protein
MYGGNETIEKSREWTKSTLSPTPFRGVMNLLEGETEHSKKEDDDVSLPISPLLPGKSTTTTATATRTKSSNKGISQKMRSRKNSSFSNKANDNSHFKRKRKRRQKGSNSGLSGEESESSSSRFVRSTLNIMKLLAKVLLWTSGVASAAAVIWYSKELNKNGTDTHLIAWFSAGAFVLLGFPISIYGITTHLANYNKPEEQCYIVRILWMVPIYSIGSWLCLRYKDHAVYIETLRDCYESYVLYSFFQYLIKTLGGEEQLILMLKDKSPTRGAHMWGMQWCVKPWLMGQPIRKIIENPRPDATSAEAPTPIKANMSQIPLKRVHWTSPFFVYNKFGVLQYVLIKNFCSIAIMILEKSGIYKEGDFTPKGGYLYICILTNISQCWALYCLIFFYYATKNELSPIRPVGKFLAVKALVFFTWWQSLGIAILYQMDLIPHYHPGAPELSSDNIGNYMPLSAEDALALDEHGGKVLESTLLGQDWTSEDVAKGLQDYLICIEMFFAAIIHIFVFPHTEYDPQAVEARARALNQRPNKHWNKRLGRKWKDWDNKSGWSGTTNASSDIELSSLNNHSPKASVIFENESPQASSSIYRNESIDEDDLRIHPMDQTVADERKPLIPLAFPLHHVPSGKKLEPVHSDGELSGSCASGSDSASASDSTDYSYADEESPPSATRHSQSKPGFVSALLDSTIPQDLRDNTVGIIKGDYVVEKKTLLHHAATSDNYDLFSRVPRMKIKRKVRDPRGST